MLLKPGTKFIGLAFQRNSRITSACEKSLHVQFRKTFQTQYAILHHVHQFVK